MGDALAVAMLGTGPASSRMCKRVECRKLASTGAPPAMEAWLATSDDEDGGHSAGYAHYVGRDLQRPHGPIDSGRHPACRPPPGGTPSVPTATGRHPVRRPPPGGTKCADRRAGGAQAPDCRTPKGEPDHLRGRGRTSPTTSIESVISSVGLTLACARRTAATPRDGQTEKSTSETDHSNTGRVGGLGVSSRRLVVLRFVRCGLVAALDTGWVGGSESPITL